MVSLILILLVACGQTDRERIDAAAQSVGETRAAVVWPNFPVDCRRLSRSGILPGDRLDVAVLKADGALSVQNARTQRCAAWYDQQRANAASEVAE